MRGLCFAPCNSFFKASQRIKSELENALLIWALIGAEVSELRTGDLKFKPASSGKRLFRAPQLVQVIISIYYHFRYLSIYRIDSLQNSVGFQVWSTDTSWGLISDLQKLSFQNNAFQSACLQAPPANPTVLELRTLGKFSCYFLGKDCLICKGCQQNAKRWSRESRCSLAACGSEEMLGMAWRKQTRTHTQEWVICVSLHLHKTQEHYSQVSCWQISRSNLVLVYGK